MNLIPIQTTQEDLQIVSGRDLHQFLEINTRYNDWFKRMCEYGFIENVDYTPITQKRVTAQGNATKQTDHNLSGTHRRRFNAAWVANGFYIRIKWAKVTQKVKHSHSHVPMVDWILKSPQNGLKKAD